VNRWTAPLVTAALLSGPAVLLGWNATALASAAVAPWTAPEAGVGASVPRSGAQGPAPAPEPRSMPGDVEPLGSSAPVPPRTVVVVHNLYPQPVEDDVSHPDDVRGTDSGPEPHPDASPVPITDPDLVPQPEPAPEEPDASPSPAPGTPQPAPEDERPPDQVLNP
jgi:hypothetical protein